MSPAPPDSVAELSRYRVGLMAELGALHQAVEAGRRLTGETLDSIAGAASGLAADDFRELDGRLTPMLTQTAGGAAADPVIRGLDTLRAEVLVWRVRAGP
jgi:ATP-dependent DNA ligase